MPQVGAAEQVAHHPRPYRAADCRRQRLGNLVERLEPFQSAYCLTKDVHEYPRLRCGTGGLPPSAGGEAASSRAMAASALRVPPVWSGTHHRRRKPGNCVVVGPCRIASRYLPGDCKSTTLPGYPGSTTPLISLVNAKGG